MTDRSPKEEPQEDDHPAELEEFRQRSAAEEEIRRVIGEQRSAPEEEIRRVEAEEDDAKDATKEHQQNEENEDNRQER